MKLSTEQDTPIIPIYEFLETFEQTKFSGTMDYLDNAQTDKTLGDGNHIKYRKLPPI